MTGNPTPPRLRVRGLADLLQGFPEMLESGVLTTTERHLYQALTLRRLEAARRELDFATLLAAGVESKQPAAA